MLLHSPNDHKGFDFVKLNLALMTFAYARYRAPRKTRGNNEKLKSARNEHKNESFYDEAS